MTELLKPNIDNLGLAEARAKLDEVIDTYNKFVRVFNEKDQLLNQLLKNQYGTSSEKLPLGSNQLSMDDIVAQAKQASSKKPVEQSQKITNQKKAPERKPGHGRKVLPDHLPREEQVIDDGPSLKEKHGESNVSELEPEVSEYLERKNPKWVVKRIIRKKYAVKTEDGRKEILTPDLPSRPIDKCIAGASVLAYVLVSKFNDHLPIYRLGKIFKREGIGISQSTLIGWQEQLYHLLYPIYQSMIRQLKKSPIITSDDTWVRIMYDNEKKTSHRGYLWCYTGDGNVIFDYHPSRSSDPPYQFLQGIKPGTVLQTDAYAAYNRSIKDYGLVSAGCMAHSRRNFFEKRDYEPLLVDGFLGIMGKGFGIEKRLKEQGITGEQKLRVRQSELSVVIEEMKCWINNKKSDSKIMAGSLRRSIEYMDNHWSTFTQVLNYADLEWTNNLTENQMRQVVIGRKNYMFCGSHEGAKRTALFYSLIGTCKLLGIEPSEYLTSVLNKVSDFKTPADQLTPKAWLENFKNQKSK